MTSFLKPLLISLAIFLITNDILAQSLGHVDERFELTSIVFRLTDDVAFVHSNPDAYIKDIDDYFSKYKEHELIEYVKKTMYSKSILDISLPASFASDIKITPKGIVWDDEWLKTFDPYDTLLTNRIWTQAELKEYLRLLNKFYKDTRFHQFFVNHKDFYKSIEDSFISIEESIDTAWFNNFFGTSFNMENIWIVPTNGDFNFAVLKKDHYGNNHNNCAVSCVKTDTLGNPYLHESIFNTLIHEICHNYTNPICERHEAEFQAVCDTLYTYVSKPLIREYYGGSLSIIHEGFNRLCEFAYFKSHHLWSDELLHEKSIGNIHRGFFWFEDMQRFLDVFFQNRDKFKTFEGFLPELKAFLERSTELMPHYYCPKYDLIRPQVVATYPAYNAVVDTNLKSITIQFSKPMQRIDARDIVDDKNISPLPKGRTYWENDYTYVVSWSGNLKAHTKYGFRVDHWFADSIDHYGSIPYDLIFETK